MAMQRRSGRSDYHLLSLTTPEKNDIETKKKKKK